RIRYRIRQARYSSILGPSTSFEPVTSSLGPENKQSIFLPPKELYRSTTTPIHLLVTGGTNH
ncbi:hypothetical protein J2P12_04380, partial [Candidatus Bathyarchaeota archaeon]|nr:hypothetical protein [Candidatus Bathyarchaeota archaeon]